VRARSVPHVAHAYICLAPHAAQVNGVSHTVLVDGGPSRSLWAGNARRLGLDPLQLEAAVLTHWHVDHSVGLGEVAQWAAAARTQCGGGGGGTAASLARNMGAPETADELLAHNRQHSALQPTGADSGPSAVSSSAGVLAASSAAQGSTVPRPVREVVFDVHPDRPYRRAFQVATGEVVPFNMVGCASAWCMLVHDAKLVCSAVCIIHD
jgi:7,8-dihydropterin-6-yl-methyl-4-(beta-D-ribofuranosyl)aminobenzene 5'-phosphate synthase